MTDRGQTTIDFAVGASVFLVTVAFVFAFAPGLVSPFTGGGTANPVVANRVADSLSQGRPLAEPGDPYALDGPVTDATLGDALDRVHDPPGTFVNATLWRPSGNGPPVAKAGPTPSSGTSTDVAWRVVSVGGKRRELRVTVW